MKKQVLCLITAVVFALLASACGAPPPVSSDAYQAAPAAPGSQESAEYAYEQNTAAAPAVDDYAGESEGDANLESYFTADLRENAGESEGSANAESYLVIDENLARLTDAESTMTFSLKVDTAAYTNVARYIESGNLPPRDAVRAEELINYFSYDGVMRFSGNNPFSIHAEVGPSPFSANRYMAFIRVKSRDIDRSALPPSNLTFLIDTSGSMDSYDKLPLLKEAFGLLVETLNEEDRVSIVTYAGSSEVVLDGASGQDKQRILSAINHLEAGGSTAGAEGIHTAYALAEKNLLKNGNNRVILATDGDFNVGVSSAEGLARLVGEKRGNGVYMSILGFGTGNLGDDIMETLSKEGNGNYSYIYDLDGAKKVLVEELASNLFTVADDVKAQVEFNPQNVRSYRLIGYENRRLKNEDFENDAKDAGEIGAGADVIMMFELELTGASESGKKYASSRDDAPDFSNELFEIRLRYKQPGEARSNLLAEPVYFDDITRSGSTDFRFACSVAVFSHLLRDSEYAGDLTVDDARALAEDSLGADSAGYRREYVRLLKQYKRLIG